MRADMVFDDDAKLIGLHNRYRNEPAELKLHIAHYINNDNTFDAASYQQQDLDLVSVTHPNHIQKQIHLSHAYTFIVNLCAAIFSSRQCDGCKETKKNAGSKKIVAVDVGIIDSRL